jgi:hypothetical protein
MIVNSLVMLKIVNSLEYVPIRAAEQVTGKVAVELDLIVNWFGHANEESQIKFSL